MNLLSSCSQTNQNIIWSKTKICPVVFMRRGEIHRFALKSGFRPIFFVHEASPLLKLCTSPKMGFGTKIQKKFYLFSMWNKFLFEKANTH